MKQIPRYPIIMWVEMKQKLEPRCRLGRSLFSSACSQRCCHSGINCRCVSGWAFGAGPSVKASLKRFLLVLGGGVSSCSGLLTDHDFLPLLSYFSGKCTGLLLFAWPDVYVSVVFNPFLFAQPCCLLSLCQDTDWGDAVSSARFSRKLDSNSGRAEGHLRLSFYVRSCQINAPWTFHLYRDCGGLTQDLSAEKRLIHTHSYGNRPCQMVVRLISLRFELTLIYFTSLDLR